MQNLHSEEQYDRFVVPLLKKKFQGCVKPNLLKISAYLQNTLHFRLAVNFNNTSKKYCVCGSKLFL